MYEKLQGIVLNVMKYSDKNSIAHVYTLERGRMAFLLPQGNTRGQRLRAAAFMPLSLIEFEARIVPGIEVSSCRDVRILHALSRIYGDPVRSSVAMFMSEFLSHAIQQIEPGGQLFSFIHDSVLLLNSATRGIANFHLCFLYHLSVFLGIQPDVGSYRRGSWFNMQEGVFCAAPPATPHSLAPAQAHALFVLSHITFENMHLFRYTRQQRGMILDMMIDYFRIQGSIVGALKSPDILRQLFD
ncbi:MAG: DNA repair protein RecO [Muribaculaceae bacterium]